jgi:hypothetical protein
MHGGAAGSGGPTGAAQRQLQRRADCLSEVAEAAHTRHAGADAETASALRPCPSARNAVSPLYQSSCGLSPVTYPRYSTLPPAL